MERALKPNVGLRSLAGGLVWRFELLRVDDTANRTVGPAVLGLAGSALALGLVTRLPPPTHDTQVMRAFTPAEARPIPTPALTARWEERSPLLRAGIGAPPSRPPTAPGSAATSALADLDLARPVQFQRPSDDRARALDCLTAAAWYESGDNLEGQRSVIQVVLNRLRHPSFPKSVCGVVFQGAERATGCQFSFTCDGSMRRRLPSAAQWSRARALSDAALNGAVYVAVRQATHFHADYVSPWWNAYLQRVTKVGAHIFYGWAGNRGALDRTAGPIQGESGIVQSFARSAPQPVAGEADLDPERMASATAPLVPVKTAGPAKSRAITLQVDPRSPSGRWALTAMGRCAGMNACQVIGLAASASADTAEVLASGMPQPTSKGGEERPLFLFIRDQASGMDLALWDCDRVARGDVAQCLPPNGPELKALMRPR